MPVIKNCLAWLKRKLRIAFLHSIYEIRKKNNYAKTAFLCVSSVDAVEAEGNKPRPPVRSGPPLLPGRERAYLFILCVTYPTMVFMLVGNSKNVAHIWRIMSFFEEWMFKFANTYKDQSTDFVRTFFSYRTNLIFIYIHYCLGTFYIVTSWTFSISHTKLGLSKHCPSAISKWPSHKKSYFLIHLIRVAGSRSDLREKTDPTSFQKPDPTKTLGSGRIRSPALNTFTFHSDVWLDKIDQNKA